MAGDTATRKFTEWEIIRWVWPRIAYCDVDVGFKLVDMIVDNQVIGFDTAGTERICAGVN